MKKRVLSLLMALVLCLSLLPTAALADESESSGGESGGTTVTCRHGGANGFDINATACPDCGTPAVAYTQLTDDKGSLWRNFASLQDALDADRQGSSTLGLLADVTGDYTINGSTDTGLDLNGYSINGTVTATGEGDKETAFSNSKSTGTIQEVVAYKNAKLAVSGAAAVIEKLTLAGGATWKNIVFLPRNPGYRVYTNYPDLSSYTWYAPTDVPAGTTELTNVSIKSLPITSKNLSFKVDGKNVSSVDRGTTVQLCAYCNTSGADVAIYVKAPDSDGYTQYTSEYKKIGTSWYYVVDLDANTIGKYSIYFTASKDGYSVTSGDKTLNVTKATIPTDAITEPTAKTLTYTGEAQELVTAGVLDAKYGTIQYSLSRSASSFSTEIPTKTDAGTYKVYYKVIGNDDYKDVNRTYTLTVTIAKKELTIKSVGVAEKTYDGTATATIESVAFDGLCGSDSMTMGKDYTVTGAFADANADPAKTVTGTVTLKNTVTNYTLPNGAYEQTAAIGKAAAPMVQDGTLDVINGTKQTYIYDFKDLLPEAPKGTYGPVRYKRTEPTIDLSRGYYLDQTTVEFEDGELVLASLSAEDAKQTGVIGTIKVTVSTDNYADFTLTLELIAMNKLDPDQTSVTVSASDITYGQTLADSTLTVNGTMKDPNTGAEVKGTFAWTEPSTKPNAGGFDAEWVFTPDSPKYAAVTGEVTVTVKRATIPEEQVTVKQKGTLTYNGSEQVAEVEITGAEGLGTITLLYAIRDDYGHNPTVPAFTDAGTHQVHYTVYSQNYDIPSGYFTVTIEPKTVTDPTVIVNGGPFTYNDGSEIKPAVTVKDGETEISDREYTVSYRDNINAGTATVTIMDKEGGNYVLGTVSETFAIGKADTKVTTAPAAVGGLVYSGAEQQLVTAGEALGGTMVYSLEETGAYTDTIPTGIAAGEYTVWYKVEGDSNHNGTEAVSVKVTIDKADAKVTTAPAAVGGLVYSGAEQQLVTAGEALGGTMVYSLEETGAYTDTIPTGIAAGEYTVYYKVESDSNHNDTAAASVTVTIGRAKLTGKVTCRTFPRYGYTLGDAHITVPALWPEGSFQWYDENGKALADSTMIVSDATYRWVFRDDLGNYEPVNGSIVLWRYAPEAAETGKSETVKNPDGSTTTTVTKPDGTVTETTTTPDGTTSTTTTDKDGNTDTGVKVSDKAVSDAKKDGSTIKLPVDGRPGQEIDIDIRTGGEDVTIEIPVSGATGGTVAIIVKGDGTEEVVRESVVTGDGIRMKVSGSVTVKVADRSKDFIDMRGHWAKNEADTVVARGLFNGTSDTMFSPSLPMTRGMVVTVLARMSGADTSGGAKWYDKGCAWAVANDISDGTAPESSITREQLVTMLYRYAKLRGVDVTAGGTALQSFSDYESVSSYAVEAMDWAVTKGLVNGINGRLEPQGAATRAQVAAIFARFLKLL